MHIGSTALTERHINSINTSVKHGTNIITIKNKKAANLGNMVGRLDDLLGMYTSHLNMKAVGILRPVIRNLFNGPTNTFG